MASNAKEAELMAQAAQEHNLLLAEAFHYRFHPMMKHLVETILPKYIPRSTIQHVEAWFHIPFFAFDKNDIRFNAGGTNAKLAGGALMDAGCYAINFVRHVMGDEPLRVTTAAMKQVFPGVDSSAEATLEFSNQRTANVSVTFDQAWYPSVGAAIVGNGHRVTVSNFIAPFVYHAISIYDDNDQLIAVEKVYDDGGDTPWITTYEFQLQTFVRAVQGDSDALAILTAAASPQEATQNMLVIDRIYEAAGLEPRQGMEVPT